MKLSITPILVVFLLMVGCHSSTTYVQSGPAGGAGYVDPYQNGGGYVDPYYDPLATIVVVGGSRGYYGPGHVFFPVVVVGGAEGYYDNNHRFVSSAPSVQQAVRDHNRCTPVHLRPLLGYRPITQRLSTTTAQRVGVHRHPQVLRRQRDRILVLNRALQGGVLHLRLPLRQQDRISVLVLEVLDVVLQHRLRREAPVAAVRVALEDGTN